MKENEIQTELLIHMENRTDEEKRELKIEKREI